MQKSIAAETGLRIGFILHIGLGYFRLAVSLYLWTVLNGCYFLGSWFEFRVPRNISSLTPLSSFCLALGIFSCHPSTEAFPLFPAPSFFF
jgi:hypothetical protein